MLGLILAALLTTASAFKSLYMVLVAQISLQIVNVRLIRLRY